METHTPDSSGPARGARIPPMTDIRLRYLGKQAKQGKPRRSNNLRVKIASNGKLSFEELTSALQKAFARLEGPGVCSVENCSLYARADRRHQCIAARGPVLIRTKVELFNLFNEGNDSHRERDFGSFMHKGHRISG